MLLYGLEKDPDFKYLHTRLLVSCPSSGPDEGGLFLLDFKHNSLKKLYTASCIGMTWVNDQLIVSTNDNQIIALNHQFQLIAKTKHRKLDFHGITKLNDKVVLIVETALNAIGCYEIGTFIRIGEIRFNPADKDIHHINDIWLEGNTLYVLMFSPYGKWYMNPVKKTGGIIAIDLVEFHPNERSFCAVVGNQTKIQVAGFTRGLAITEDTIFIGQSRMRHVLRIPHEFPRFSLFIKTFYWKVDRNGKR